MLSSELTPDELVRLARVAEDCGYDEIWYTDQRFWRDCYAGLTQLAFATERVRLGPGVNDPFTRHPAMIAMAIATLDEISGGRAQLGLGVGGSGIAQMHLSKTRPVRALQEAIEIIRLLLAGGSVDYAGELFQLTTASISAPLPNRPIPISVATHGPQVLTLCGKLADGVLLGNMGSRDAVETAAAHVMDGVQLAGRSPNDVTLNLRLEAIVTDRSEDAISVLRKRMAHRLVSSYPNWNFLGNQWERLDPGIEPAAAAQDRETIARLLKIEDIRTQALAGNPDEVVDQLGDLVTNDVGNVTIRPYGFANHGQELTIRHFAETVWPRFLERQRGRVSAGI